MIAALVCREMHWTWKEYQDTPAHFIEIVKEMLSAEAEQTKKSLQKSS